MNEIRIKRQDMGFTQEKLSRLLKVNRSTVAKWETGESQPRSELLPQIAKILNCKIDDLFSIKSSGNTPSGSDSATDQN